MSKRGNDNPNFGKDDVNSGDDEEDDEENGMSKPFQRASEDVMKARKIIKIARRPGASGAAASGLGSNPFGSFPLAAAPINPVASVNLTTTAPAVSNPFASVKLVPSAVAAVLTNPFLSVNSIAPSPAFNPFASVKLVPSAAAANPFLSANSIAPPAASSSASNPFAAVKIVATPSVASAVATNPFASFVPAPVPIPISVSAPVTVPPSSLQSTSSSGGNSSSGCSDAASKLKKLNASFMAWVNKQSEAQPLALWSEGLKDYINYANDIEASSSSSESKSNITSVAAAPIVAAVSDPSPVAAVIASSNTNNPFIKSAAPAAPPVNNAPFNPFAPTGSSNPFSASAYTAPVPSFAVAPVAAKSMPFAFPTAPSGSIIPAAPSASSMLPMPAFAGFNQPLKGGQFQVSGVPAVNMFAPPANTASTASGGGGDDSGDEEGEPMLEPEKVLKNESDNSVELASFPCKLMRYNNEDKEWKDIGKGTFRISKDPTSGKSSIVVRDVIGKLLLNAGFYKSMKIQKAKKAISFSALVSVYHLEDDEAAGHKKGETSLQMKNFTVKLSAENVDKAHSIAEQQIAALQ